MYISFVFVTTDLRLPCWDVWRVLSTMLITSWLNACYCWIEMSFPVLFLFFFRFFSSGFRQRSDCWHEGSVVGGGCIVDGGWETNHLHHIHIHITHTRLRENCTAARHRTFPSWSLHSSFRSKPRDRSGSFVRPEDRSDNSSISDLGTTRLLLSSDDVTPPFRLTSLLLCSRGTQWSTGAECFCDSSACWWVHVSSGQAVCVTGETGAQRPVSRSARVRVGSRLVERVFEQQNAHSLLISSFPPPQFFTAPFRFPVVATLLRSLRASILPPQISPPEHLAAVRSFVRSISYTRDVGDAPIRRLQPPLVDPAQSIDLNAAAGGGVCGAGRDGRHRGLAAGVLPYLPLLVFGR